VWGCKDSRQKHIQYAVVIWAVWLLAIIIQRHAKPKAQTTTNHKLYKEGNKTAIRSSTGSVTIKKLSNSELMDLRNNDDW